MTLKILPWPGLSSFHQLCVFRYPIKSNLIIHIFPYMSLSFLSLCLCSSSDHHHSYTQILLTLLRLSLKCHLQWWSWLIFLWTATVLYLYHSKDIITLHFIYFKISSINQHVSWLQDLHSPCSIIKEKCKYLYISFGY